MCVGAALTCVLRFTGLVALVWDWLHTVPGTHCGNGTGSLTGAGAALICVVGFSEIALVKAEIGLPLVIKTAANIIIRMIMICWSPQKVKLVYLRQG